MQFVICTTIGGTHVWYLGEGRWTPDRKGARVFDPGESFVFQAPGRIWIETVGP